MNVNFFSNINTPQIVAHPEMAPAVQVPTENPTAKRKALNFQLVTPETFHDTKLGKTVEKICKECGIDKTPEWRTGPDGKVSLCNKCGLRFKNRERKALRVAAANEKVAATKEKMNIKSLLNPQN